MNIVPTKLRYFHERGVQLRGVIHVGMSWGEEIADYLYMGASNVIGFEPLPEAFNEAVKLYGHDPRVILVNAGLGDTSEKMTIRKIEDPNPMVGHPVGTGGSSFLLDVHPLPPDCTVSPLTVPVYRFEDWFRNATIHVPHPGDEMKKYNALVIDVQGFEMNVLRGFGDLLQYFDVANIECSRNPIYYGEEPAETIVKFMRDHGFEQMTPIEDHNDILFQRL